MLERCSGVRSVLELGRRENLRRLQNAIPNAQHSALEVSSLLRYRSERTYDLVFLDGVFGLTKPDVLQRIYDLAYYASDKYICICEYYETIPPEIPYISAKQRRDFAGEMIDLFSLRLLDYGFVYHRDGFEDCNWFLLVKDVDSPGVESVSTVSGGDPDSIEGRG